MKKYIAAAAMGLLAFAATSAAAETCGGVYAVQPGDSLSVIADKLYKDAGKWSAIHSRNIDTIGPKPSGLRAGMALSLACLEGLPLGLDGGKEISASVPVEAKPVQIAFGSAEVRHRINLLTADDFAPFTGKDLHNGGMMTDVLNAAMRHADPEQGYAVHWVDLWTAHEEPLLSNALLDAGFPWYKPDCENSPEEPRCENFLFSDPMFEVLVLMFTDKARPLAFTKDEDLFGKTFCRPQGYETYLFEQQGRHWLRDGKVEVVQPLTTAECYAMVLDGKADAVVMNEFTGRAQIKELGLSDRFDAVPEPISIQALHVIVHKSHPKAQQLMEMVNASLRGIRQNGTYQAIIEDHMARVWAGY
ncbi:transporter substrate-binding domain-containing protein [Leisingera methylohalidivorans]|uniref:Peptidoglycan-binding protein LysM n=1 Tax=Leisingera methylohalidivorans DSM 14336 TaxID=999552 RepID=V9VVB1_9RHOB|nr:transporter substrate-binding domain-containing protein [Leisingera methylohalidivorans]AHD01659.1 peptidoglycan-binding protein LysM [Leisingera methylohalidivorans DSM 14336]